MEDCLNIIHSSERTERYKVLMNELSTQGIENYAIWDAVYDSQSVMAGINKAHKQIVYYAKNKELPYVIIAEDDIKFTHQDSWRYYLSKRPEVYDLYLGGIFLGEVKNGVVSEFTALHLYTVHQNFYDTFLSTPDTRHLDECLANMGNYIVCQPMVAIQHNGYSQNTQSYCNFDFIFENKILYNG